MNTQPGQASSWKDPMMSWSHKAHFTREGSPDVDCDHGEGVGGRMWTLGPCTWGVRHLPLGDVQSRMFQGTPPPEKAEPTFFTSKMGARIPAPDTW